MKYDVFISSKSEDYHLAEDVYDFLRSKGLSVFIASEELKKIGEAHFSYAIDDVLDHSIHMVVVASSVEYIKSKWVKYEWSTFSNDLKSGYRSGNLITILSTSIELKSLPASLRHQQSFQIENYKDDILDYLPVVRDVASSLIQEPPKDKEIIEISTAVFKFYSNENCQIFLEGEFVTNLVGMSDEPYRLSVHKKGDYRFKCVNLITGEVRIHKEHIDAGESKEVEVLWEGRKPMIPDYEWPNSREVTGDSFTVQLGSAYFNLVRVEGGRISIGATAEQERHAESNEFPAHEVFVPTFYMGKFPVTQNVWEIVMGYNKSFYKDKEDRLSKFNNVIRSAVRGSVLGPVGMFVGGFRGALRADKSTVESSDKGHYPAENVTFDEAQEFVRRLSLLTNIKFDLPTEEEWEYAARGGCQSKNCLFAGSDEINDVAWYRDNAEGTTHPVGEKQPNELGLYDMCGNVWEWTRTPASSYSNVIEPKGDVYIRRGGSWWHEGRNCRVSFRYASHRSKKTSGLGLRVVVRENLK